MYRKYIVLASNLRIFPHTFLFWNWPRPRVLRELKEIVGALLTVMADVHANTWLGIISQRLRVFPAILFSTDINFRQFCCLSSRRYDWTVSYVFRGKSRSNVRRGSTTVGQHV